MQDLIPRNKLVFWGFWIVIVSFCAIPSLVLVENAQRYWDFLSSWQPGTVRATVLRSSPRQIETLRDDSVPEPRFVEFRLKAPKAKSVALAGDFNHWSAQSLPLYKNRKGDWEVLVPLPPGKYEYAFVVDGAWLADPKARETARREDRNVSVKQVE